MTRIERGVASCFRGKSAGVKVPADQILTLDSADGWDLDRVAMSRERAMKISTVARCVELLANSMAVLPIFITNEGTHERARDHPLLRVLRDRANEDMTLFDYTRLMMCNVLLKGNAYAHVWRNQATGEVQELLPLPPDCVTVYVDQSGNIFYLYTNPRTGQMYRLHQTEVIHYKAYSTDGINGISVLSRAAQTMMTAEAAAKYEASVYANGGRPSGVLTVATDLSNKYIEETKADGTVERTSYKDKIRQEWDRVHRGPDNAFRLAVLDNGLSFTPIAMNNTDAQFVESNEVRVADVCRFFGTPLHLVFAGKMSYNSNEQQSIEFVRYTLLGYVTQWQQEDGYKLLLPSERADGWRIKRELKVFLQGDSAAQANWYRTLHELGAYSVNDILALDDRPAVPGGDARYASLNYVPLEDWAALSRQRAEGGNGGG